MPQNEWAPQLWQSFDECNSKLRKILDCYSVSLMVRKVSSHFKFLKKIACLWIKSKHENSGSNPPSHILPPWSHFSLVVQLQQHYFKKLRYHLGDFGGIKVES